MKVKKGDTILIKATVYATTRNGFLIDQNQLVPYGLDCIHSVIESPVDWESVERLTPVEYRYDDAPETWHPGHLLRFHKGAPSQFCILRANDTYAWVHDCRLVEQQP